ncbi:hypothetical protein V6N12_064244 [Hibiscus sabdariffa]|uniref:Pentatricopeptide repeat-containing protein n=1 Tax=Hibiscus sabdariffa TaxID=183260 RepID=A0ABR2G5K2_9ROSI
MHHLSSILSLCDNSSCVVGEARDEEMARACIYSPNVHEKVVYSNRVIKPTLALRMHLEVHFSFWWWRSSVDYFKEVDTHVSDYPELSRRMQGYAISGDFNNAPCTLNLMKSFDGKPTVSRCMIVTLSCTPTPTVVTSDMLLHNLRRNSYSELHIGFSKSVRRGETKRQKLKPDVFTYGSFISGLCKEGKISAALQMWNQMLERGIVPSVAIFNTLLHAMFWEIL